jgi:hypothetical protein
MMAADTNLVVVGAFATEVSAEIARTALASAGIDAMIRADSVGRMRPHVAWATGGFRLLVREEDEADAREVLESPDPAA